MKIVGIILIGLAMIVATNISTAKSIYVDLDLKDVTVEKGIEALFAGSGHKYRIEPGVSGRIVELRLRGVTFDQALKSFAEAADFKYIVIDGIYVISPIPSEKQSTQRSTNIVVQGSERQPPKRSVATAQPYPQPPPIQGQSQGAAKAVPSNVGSSAPQQQVVVNQHAPVFYGQPGMNYGYGYGYGYYPGYYQFGNLGVLSGWAPVVFGAQPSVVTFGPGPAPPPGWVSPDVLRFMRYRQAITPLPYIYGYGY